MKIVVIGAGAMGSLFGGLLSESGNDVTLVDVSKAHIDAINRDGLLLTTSSGSRYIKVAAKYAQNVNETPDLVIIFTKTVYSADAMESAKRFIGDNTYVMTLQNGLGNVELIEKYIPKERIIVGMTNFPSDLVGPGRVSSMGKGIVVAMSANGEDHPFLRTVEKEFNKSGLNCEISADVFVHIWEKVAFNAALNTLTSVTRLRIGDMSSTKEGHSLAFEIAAEVISVANKCGINAKLEAVNKNLEMAFAEHGDHMPSMMQDMLAKRQTEINFINGAVVKQAESVGIDVPVTRVMYSLIKLIQQRYINQVLE